MNKAKFTSGIVIALLGGAIMLFSMLSAIIHLTGKLYKDIRTFNINLQASRTSSVTAKFSIEKEKALSLWLKLPNRQIENKDFKIDVFLIGENDALDAKFGEDFKLGYFRNSSGKGQYYKLGSHSFPSGFNGYLRYEAKGKWAPPFKGELVLRESSASSFPVEQIKLFVAGILGLVIGISTIVKNIGHRFALLGSGR